MLFGSTGGQRRPCGGMPSRGFSVASDFVFGSNSESWRRYWHFSLICFQPYPLATFGMIN